MRDEEEALTMWLTAPSTYLMLDGIITLSLGTYILIEIGIRSN